MERTADTGALRGSQVLSNPLKTLVPVNASRNIVVDKQVDLLVFSWRRRHGESLPLPTPDPRNKPPGGGTFSSTEPLEVASNSLTPFYTAMKPTCGFRFSRETDHKRRLIGIPASNPVMWRSKGHQGLTSVRKPQSLNKQQ